jgi:iron complex transport system ATP-binding protein
MAGHRTLVLVRTPSMSIIARRHERKGMSVAQRTRSTPHAGDVVTLEQVTLFRGETVILKDVSWRVARGEHWAVLGANGSGKTTLLRIVSGYMWPSRGEAVVLGERFGETDIQALRRRIGWVSSALHDWVPPHETALDTVLTGESATIGLRGEASAEEIERAEALLGFLGCADRADHPFGTLSQGEAQKVLIARALLPEPELLILDEVCAGLDPAAREDFLSTLEALCHKKDGPTLVFVTHHIEEIMPVFTHVLILKRGEVLAQGPKDEVLSARVLEDALGISILLEHHDGRFWPRIGRRK